MDSALSRRAFVALIASAGATALAGCSPEAGDQEPASDNPSQPNEEAQETDPVEQDGKKDVQPVQGRSGVLVADFSWSGHTWAMANRIAQSVPGATLVRLETQQPYPEDGEECRAVVQQEAVDGVIRPLVADVEGFEGYDTVFLGFPLWWSDVPGPIQGFVQQHDWNAKRSSLSAVPAPTGGPTAWTRSTGSCRARSCSRGSPYSPATSTPAMPR